MKLLTSLCFLRPALLLGAISFIGALWAVPQNNGGCYELMISQCQQEASNAAEGGYDQAYDQCIANWYANSRCGDSTPRPTVVSGPVPSASNSPRKPQSARRK